MYFCDFEADESYFYTGAYIYIDKPGDRNYLEYLTNELTAFNALPFANPDDPNWRGVFAYISWGYRGPDGIAKFYEPAYINWKRNYYEPPTGECNAVRIWARKGVIGEFTLYQTDPKSTGVELREPGVILE